MTVRLLPTIPEPPRKVVRRSVLDRLTARLPVREDVKESVAFALFIGGCVAGLLLGIWALTGAAIA